MVLAEMGAQGLLVLQLSAPVLGRTGAIMHPPVIPHTPEGESLMFEVAPCDTECMRSSVLGVSTLPTWTRPDALQRAPFWTHASAVHDSSH